MNLKYHKNLNLNNKIQLTFSVFLNNQLLNNSNNNHLALILIVKNQLNNSNNNKHRDFKYFNQVNNKLNNNSSHKYKQIIWIVYLEVLIYNKIIKISISINSNRISSNHNYLLEHYNNLSSNNSYNRIKINNNKP